MKLFIGFVILCSLVAMLSGAVVPGLLAILVCIVPKAHARLLDMLTSAMQSSKTTN